MRNRLTIAAPIALLASIANVNPLNAQFAQTPNSVAGALEYTTAPSKYIRAPWPDDAPRAKTAIRRDRHAGRKGHVLGSPPNLRKIAEKVGYKRVSELVNFPKFFPGLGI